MPSWDGVQGAALLKNLLGSTDLRHRGAEIFEQLLGDLARDTLHGREGLGRRLRKILRAVKARVDQRLRACPPDAFHMDEFLEEVRAFGSRGLELEDPSLDPFVPGAQFEGLGEGPLRVAIAP